MAAGGDFVCAFDQHRLPALLGSAALQDHDLGLASAFSHIVAEDYLVCAWSPAYAPVVFRLAAPGLPEAAGPPAVSSAAPSAISTSTAVRSGGSEPGSFALGFASGRILDPTFGNEPPREVAAGELAVCALGEDENGALQPRADGEYQPPPEGV
ncbi:MAG: hypothetical protein R3F43_19685 [bacterium]